MFGLRRDGTVAVDQEASQWDDRIARVGEWTHIKELGFDITGIARYVPVGLREDGTVCAITEYEDGEPYGWWDFTGWRDVQKLFSENRGKKVLKVDVETGTYETDTKFAWGKGVNHNVI